MALHPDFPESPHEIIDIAQGIPPFNLLGVLDIHCAPLERGLSTWRAGKPRPYGETDEFSIDGGLG